ncbi:MAG: hypothetical protein NUV48_14105 [Peptococcaceae bacterium]|nr:hypothetical protein [Peptococcaceae bacterium]
MRTFHVPIYLGDWSVAEAVRRAYMESVQVYRGMFGTDAPFSYISSDGYSSAVAQDIAPYVSLVLYLCSVSADYAGEPPQHPSQRPPAKKKLVAANETRVWEVGVRVGAALRAARVAPGRIAPQSSDQEEKSRSSPRPHYRRAHWHHFWVGPRKGERRLTLKWLHPVLVNVRKETETPATVRPVKKRGGHNEARRTHRPSI